MSGDESLCNNPLLLGRKHFNYLQSQTNEVTRDQQNNDLKLMMTTEEAAAEDESTKKRSRSLSKSEQKPRAELRHITKRSIMELAAEPMSFGKPEIIDEMSAENFGTLSLFNANQINAGDQCLDQNQSGGSSVFESDAWHNISTLPATRQQILVQKLGPNFKDLTESNEYPCTRETLRQQKSEGIRRDSGSLEPNEATLLRIRDKKNLSALSLMSRATSNASYNVKSATGQVTQHLKGKLPKTQHHSLLQQVDKGTYAQGQRKVPRKSSLDNPLNLHNRLGKLIEASPVPEQHTLEQGDNSLSETSPPNIAAFALTNNSGSHFQNKPPFMLNLSFIPNSHEKEVDLVDQADAPNISKNFNDLHEKDFVTPLGQRLINIGKNNGPRANQDNTEPKNYEKKLIKRFQKSQTCEIANINHNPFVTSMPLNQEIFDNLNAQSSGLSRASSNLHVEDKDSESDNLGQDDIAIRPQVFGNEHGNSSTKEAEKKKKTEIFNAKHKMSRTMTVNKQPSKSQTDSQTQFVEFKHRVTKSAIFGDPWNQSKDRNKQLLSQLIQGNTQHASEKLFEQAAMIFNENPTKGISFCIQQQLFSEKASNIAKFIKNMTGLSKFAIGQYLAAPKEMNQNVLEIFSQQFDYKDTPIDESIRKFLATFRLPGEGDQIQRIIEKFSTEYKRQNPAHFDTEDEAFLLAYCLIFLNTLNHNPNVDPKNRLTCEAFLKQCRQGAPRYPQEEVKNIYYRICDNQFKTDTQDVERVLGRVGPFFNIDPSKSLTKDHDIQMVQRGQMFVKYGRRGQPHPRFVYISADQQNLVWCVKTLSVVSSSEVVQKGNNKSLGATTPGKESKICRILLEDIVDIKVGINATNVLKKHGLPPELDSLCMSIITSSRTLDLKANDSQTRNKWVQYFYDRVLKEKLEELGEKPFLNSMMEPKEIIIRSADSEILRKHSANNRYAAYKRVCNESEHQLEEIWVNKIMTNIDAHWDYVKNQPKIMTQGFDQQRKLKNKQSKTNSQINKSMKSRRITQLLCCFQRHRNSRSPTVLRFERKGGRDSQLTVYSSPAKKHSSAVMTNTVVEGLTSLQRIQSARSDHSFIDSAASPYFSSHANATKQSARKDTEERGLQNLDVINLEELWRFGIPFSIRRVLWPFKIGNKLGISKELYQINRKQGLALRSQVLSRTLHKNCFDQQDGQSYNLSQQQSMGGQSYADHSNISANCIGRVLDFETLKKIEEDIDQFFEITGCLSIMQNKAENPPKVNGLFSQEVMAMALQPENIVDSNGSESELQRKKESLTNLVLSFLVYRPDVGYVKNLSFLAGTILAYCKEASAFVCFANFVHQPLFIKLFRGYIQDIKLRIDIFDSYFLEYLPELHQHFEGLEIDTAFFLTDWFVTVFVKNVDFKIACRIWDNMILDGEIFAFKTGLALLLYFQWKLLKQCHFQIKETLSDMRNQIDEDSLFAIIEDQITLDSDEFLMKCQSQTWGHQKAKLLSFANDYLSEGQ